ncbi:Bloom syndrome protein-like [Actinia tenebrosa]|uniref:RecQ-like DNA helicase BLM n=1 Tax=Actinia tenebrosa TaxID=6105 RepID=A0A6P8HQE9_ACTTE|nr:Bloom syndrome protein-like [Actinia tenebrosa]
MAAHFGQGVPCNNLAQQLEMFNKNKKISGNLSKGKKGSDSKENGPSLFQFFKKDKSNVQIAASKPLSQVPVNISTPIQSESSSTCKESTLSVGKQVARIQPFSKSDSQEGPQSQSLKKPVNVSQNQLIPVTLDNDDNDFDINTSSSPHSKKIKLHHSTSPACKEGGKERKESPVKMKEVEPVVDLTLDTDEINWSFGIGSEDDALLDAYQLNQGHDGIDDAENHKNNDDDDDIEGAPDSPTLPTYYSPPPSPQPATQEIPTEDCDNYLYNEDELEELERENVLKAQDKVALHPLLKQTPRQTPTTQIQDELLEIQTLQTKTMEDICCIIDKVDTDVLRRSLPVDVSVDKLTDAQNLRKKLRSKAGKLEAMLKQRGESINVTPVTRTTQQTSTTGGRSNLCSTPAIVNNRTSTSTTGSFIQSPPCGESFYFDNNNFTANSSLGVSTSTSSNWRNDNENRNSVSSASTSFVPQEISEDCDSEDDWEMACMLEQSYFNKTNRATATVSSAKSTPQFKKGLNLSKSSASTSQNLNSSFGPSPAKKTMIPNDGDDDELRRTDFPFSKDMWKILRDIFRIKSLRTNQLQVINAAMQKKNCFVLMPTGGGKSLCYQVTALMGKGVTFVVSPLKSLIQDQVQRLTSMRIPATHLSGDVTSDEAMKHVSSVYQDLSLRQPNLKLVYVTPEKLSASGKLNSALASLHSRGLLDRFVIDEAHCISQWGHDFRPDYKKLSQVMNKFQGVPVMALTATATPRVRTDIENQLRLNRSNCKRFSQSFNRPNLKFQIFPKKKTMEEMTNQIKSKYPHSSGIVYCLSRNECSRVADSLKAAGIKAVAYHAGLSDQQRVRTQEIWIKGQVKVVCATIAFGMGIDKGDVRYVIHYSMPKSLEGYYQECGRAGRDGKKAECILYYSYNDMHRIRRMIDGDQVVKDVHMDNLYRVVQFCENQTECRRVQLLHYFGETNYDKAECREHQETVCDNCSNTLDYVEKDVNEDAKAFVRTVNELVHQGNSTWQRPRNLRYPLSHFVDIFKGSNNARVVQEGHERCALFARGKDFHRNDAERLARMLVMKDVLGEKLVIGNHENVIGYAVLGSKAMHLLNGRYKLPPFSVRSEKARAQPKPKKKRKGTTSDVGTDDVSSTDTDVPTWNDGGGDYGHSRYWNDNEVQESTRGGKRKRKTTSKRKPRTGVSDDQTGYSSGGYSSSNGLKGLQYSKKRGGGTARQPTKKQNTGLGLMAPPRPISRF